MDGRSIANLHVNVMSSFLIAGWFCKMLRIDRHKNWKDIRWKNHLQKQNCQTTSKRKGKIEGKNEFNSLSFI